MRRYLRTRLLAVIPTLVAATLILFVLLRLLPGDPALLVLLGPEGEGIVSQEKIEALRQRLGTDRPAYEQYLKFVVDLARLDFGKSLVTERPVVDELALRLPVTVELAILGTALAALVGISAGIAMAVRRDTWIDYILRIVTIGGLAVPTFLTGTLVVMLLVKWFNWLAPLEYAPLFADPKRNLQQMIWPVLIVAYSGAAVIARMTRSTMLEAIAQDYVRTARAKGLAARSVTLGHVLKNAMLPTFTFVGVVFVGALNGAVVLEYIFVVPGIGAGLVDAFANRDYTTIQGFLSVIIFIVLIANVLIDVMYTWFDPRITYT